MAGAETFVNLKMKQRRAALFTKKRDPYCEEAKGILSKYGLDKYDWEAIEIGSRQDCTQIENYFLTICLQETREVPQLFLDQKHFGGIEQIRRAEESGLLQKRLVELGLIDETLIVESVEVKDEVTLTVEEPINKPPEESIDKPVEESMDKPVEVSVDKPPEDSMDKPSINEPEDFTEPAKLNSDKKNSVLVTESQEQVNSEKETSEVQP